MRRPLVVHVVGARPNYMKVAPVHAALAARGMVEQLLLHTGQHYDDDLKGVFFRELPLPAPDRELRVGSGTHGEQTAAALIGIEKLLLDTRPEMVLVAGDVNSTLAGALAAVKLGIPVCHLEAGLRSFDWSMPEEHNRTLTDHVSSLLLTHSDDANDNLAREGIEPDRVRLVGNTMIDSLLAALERAQGMAYRRSLGLEAGGYVLVTLHRPALVDDDELLTRTCEALRRLAAKLPVVFPVHPRTRERIAAARLDTGGVRLLRPLSYLSFLSLQVDARFVVTDSGGIQEETTVLGVPCFTLRANTERPVTITHGTNTLLGLDPEGIARIPERPARRPHGVPPLWDGAAGGRAAIEIERVLGLVPGGGGRSYDDVVTVVAAVMWGCVAALVWTHAAYPAATAALSRIVHRRVRRSDATPTVTVIVAAYNEDAVIERRVRNLLELDYPSDCFEVVVASDASDDGTDELAAAAGARVVRNGRGGKVAAQDRAVRETTSDVLAFSDANSTWAPDSLRRLVGPFADSQVAYVCGQLALESADGSNKEGVYWRYEMAVRQAESTVGSVTGGNGAIYAVRRADYVEVDPRFGHDLSLPYLMVQNGKRAVYEPSAVAYEKPTPTNESEYRRKVRMFEHCWLIVLRGRMLRHQPPGYLVALVSHRHLRYASGVLHLILLATSLALVAHGWVYDAVLAAQVLLLAAAAAGVGIARYYVLVSWATVVALWNYLRRGVPATWQVAEGTR